MYVVPSLPSELMKTPVPPDEVAPKIWPIKQLSLHVRHRAAAIQITSLAVVTLSPAAEPNAILPRPELSTSALAPTAVLNAPSALLESALNTDGRVGGARATVRGVNTGARVA